MQQFWVAASLLWLAGVGLRLTILAVPPVIALMQADLALTGTQVGILSGLPVILFGIAALPGSLLIARFGALATMVGGLMVAGVFSGLRGALLDVYWLYATTIVMSAGIAVMQPALPALVRQWMPQKLSFGTALFTNGLLVGETLPVMLTLSLVFLLVGHSWRWSLVFWGLPLLLIALLTIALAPRPQHASRCGAGAAALVAELARQGGVAGRPDPRLHQQHLFRHQRVPAGPPDRRRPRGPDRRRAHGDQFRPVAGVLHGARDLAPAGAARLAVHAGRPADDRLHRRHRPDGELLDRRVRRHSRLPRRHQPDAGADAAGAVERARRRGAHLGRDVHHLLYRGPRRVRHRRRRLGPRRRRRAMRSCRSPSSPCRCSWCR